MGRLCALLFLFAATAHAQTLAFGPERALAPQPFVPYAGPVGVAGAATNGKRVLVVWAPADIDDPFRDDAAWHVTFLGGETKRLPSDGPRGLASARAVVWSGAAFFVFMDDGHATRVSSDGTLSRAPSSYSPTAYFASNGDGFIEVEGLLSRARLFDRNGVLLRDIRVDAPGGQAGLVLATRENGDYVILEHIIPDAHTTFLRQVIVHPDGTHEEQRFGHAFGFRSTFSAAGDAVMIDKTLLIGGREIELEAAGTVTSDGANYIVITPKNLRRFTRTGSLIDETPGDYTHVVAVVPRRSRKPLVIAHANDNSLLANGEVLQLRRIIDQSDPAASSDGTSTVAAWRERNVLKVKVLGRPGEATVGLEARTWSIRAASIPGVHFVVWFEQHSVRMVRVASDGTLLDHVPVVVAKTADPLYGWGSAPVLATNGRELFVAWHERTRVRARHVTRDGAMDEPFDLAAGWVHSLAMFDGEHYLLFWFELGGGSPSFIEPNPPQRLLSTVINGREAASPEVIAPKVWSSASLAITPSHVFWSDLLSPNSHDVDVNKPEPPAQLYLRSVSLGRGGTPATAPLEVLHMERYGRSWPSMDLAVASDHLVWTDEHDLYVMPAAGGEPGRVGPADWGTLNVVRTNDGLLLVYAVDGNVVTRSVGVRPEP